MFAWDKHIKLLQLIGALLAVPAGVAGTYSVYRTYVAGSVSCHDLRSSIIATLDKNLPGEAKRALLREDVEKFEKNCGDQDPDARVIFHAAVTAPKAAQNTTPAVASAPTAIFGLSRSGERRGWVALFRRNGDGSGNEPNFDGFTVSASSLPPVGTLLTARSIVPVWLAPPPAGQGNDSSVLQGRIAAGTCVKVVAVSPPARRFWAEVAPETCK